MSTGNYFVESILMQIEIELEIFHLVRIQNFPKN